RPPGHHRQERDRPRRGPDRGRPRGRRRALQHLPERGGGDRQGAEGARSLRPPLKVALLTREYPPEVYGGAGVHAAYLSRDLAHLVDLDVHCFGAPRAAPRVTAHPAWADVADGPNGDVLGVLSVDLRMAAAAAGADVVHTHTW